MKNGIDAAIQKLDDKMAVLLLAKQELVAVRDDSPFEEAPKVKRGRKRRAAGLPSAVPPASDANYAGKL